MATNIIAAGDTATSSAEFTITGATTIFCTPGTADGRFLVRLLFKNSASAFVPFASVNHEEPLVVLAGPGTYRADRISGSVMVDKS